MTSDQERDLLMEWGLYGPSAQKKMIDEYLSITRTEVCNRENFLTFLKERLDIEIYWKKIGLI